MVNGVSTLGLNERLQYGVKLSQNRIAELQSQVSSGYVTDRYAGLGLEAEKVVKMEGSVSKYKSYISNIKTVNARLDKMELAVNEMQGLASQFRAMLTGATSGPTAQMSNVAIDAQKFLERVVGLLNTSHDDRHLFSGTRTDTPPVDLARYGVAPYNAAPYTPPDLSDPANTPNANTVYYQGDDTVLQVRIDDEMTVDYGVTADNQAFAKLIAAMRTAIANPTDVAQLDEALAMSVEAITGLSEVVREIGIAGKTLDNQQIYHEQIISRLNDYIGAQQYTDVAAAMAKISVEETQLQASFMSVVRVNGLSLLNFLS